jgi:hypothetical protein
MTDSAGTSHAASGASDGSLGTVDHLRLLRLIGRGPQASVYAAEDSMAGRLVAAKAVPPELANSSAEAVRLRRAILPAAHLSHVGLVALRHLHEVWDADAAAQGLGIRQGTLLLISDLVNGRDLSQWLTRQPSGGLSRRAVLRVFSQVGEALDHAHAAGVCHGALAPGNIIVRADGQAVVADVAASRELRFSLQQLGVATAQGRPPGMWVAPEVQPGTPPSPAEDIYAFAALLLGALAGDLAGPAQAHLPLPWLSAAQNHFIGTALSSDPAVRPGRCGPLVTALQVAAADAGGHESIGRNRSVGSPVATVGSVPRPEPVALPVVGELAPAPTPVAAPEPVSRPVETPHPAAYAAPAPAAPPAPAVAAVAVAPPVSSEPEPVVAPPVVPAPAAPAAAPTPRQPLPRAPRGGKLLNAALAAAAVLLLCLAGTWVWRSVPQAPAGAAREEPWSTVDEQSRLAQRFAYSLKLAPGPDTYRLKFRLVGQTRRLDIELDGSAVSAREYRGRGRGQVLATATLAKSCSAGDAVVIAATPDSVGLFVNGVRALAAAWPLEAMEKAQWQVPPGTQPPGECRLQKIGNLVFADDFMHGEDELGEWKPVSGTWKVHALQNPIRSANPFSFAGQGDDALATAGQWFWRGYRFAAAAHPLAGSSFGLKLCWTAPDHTYEVLWSPAAQGPGTLRLTRVVGSETTELAKADISFMPAQWYRLEASQLDGTIEILVDGTPVLSAIDPNPLLGGAVGLWTRGEQGTVFDDVTVGPVEQVRFDFGKQSGRGVSLLRPLSGSDAGRDASPKSLEVGGVLLENACVTTSLQGFSNSKAGDPLELLARRRSGEELALQVGRQADGWRARLLARQVGREQVLADESLAAPAAEASVSLHVLGGEAWASVDGALVAFAPDVPVRGQGVVGVRLPAGSGVTQRALDVHPERMLAEVENRVEMFTHEASMQNWSSPVLEWNVEMGGKWPAYWHRSDFWQDVTAVMRVEDLPAETATGVVGLALRNPEKGDAAEPPSVSLVLNPEVREVQLLGLPQGLKQLKLVKQRVGELGLERRGGHVLARVNGQVVWNEALPDSLRGLCEIGRYGRGNTKEWAEAVSLRAAGLDTYPFNDAPSEWLPVTGVWEMTNRWQCDPRWSFYSGVLRGGVACNWNKLRHGPNVTVEFFAGPKMDSKRGDHYQYAADLNAVVCADGRDITSGYSFMFGGWDDRGAQIVRGTQLVGENSRLAIPRDSSTHRRWFYVKLRKNGNRLSYWVDGSLVATYDDATPLTGDRFGLWTWDNGIMVAQCRVSTDAVTRESVLPASSAPAAPKSPYNP